MDPFIAIADANRRRIIEALAQGERSSGDLATKLDVVAQTTSQHLKVLLVSGVATVRRSGKQRIYSLDRSALFEIRHWLDRVAG